MLPFQIYITPAASVTLPVGIVSASVLVDVTGIQPEWARDGELRTYSGGRRIGYFKPRRKFKVTTHRYAFGEGYDTLLAVQKVLSSSRYVALLLHRYADIAGFDLEEGDEIICVAETFSVAHDYDLGVKTMELELLEAQWTV